MSIIEKAVTWAIGIANDNEHGYSQTTRWGPSYDCSSLIISAYEQAGVPVKTKGATYTGNMRKIFKESGFVEVTRPYRRGDVLLNEIHHTAMMISDTQIVHASTSNGTTDTRDNSGNEIRTQSYYDYPWDCVLRYVGPDEETAADDGEQETPQESAEEYVTAFVPWIKIGATGLQVELLQYALCRHGYLPANSRKKDKFFDGIFGEGTQAAIEQFQIDNNISPCEIGTLGPETIQALLGV